MGPKGHKYVEVGAPLERASVYNVSVSIPYRPKSEKKYHHLVAAGPTLNFSAPTAINLFPVLYL